MNDIPAFPNPHYINHKGMTMRDYFAAKALVGLIDAALVANDERGISKDDVCIYCYEWADAMMKARETK